MPPQSRRQFLQRLAAAAATSASIPGLLACSDASALESPVPGGGSARLSARVRTPTIPTTRGSYPITPGALNDGTLFVPSKYTGAPMPLVLGLHGATMTAASQISLLSPYAESRGFLLLAVGSRGITWDVMTSKYSYDVQFIDAALKWTFDRVAVDARRIVVEGFSDGASYTLGLALANGDLFTRAVAFSPGFIPPSDSPAVGKPAFFDSHGTNDPILPIDNASRRIVPQLKDRGYSVEYMEFSGGHSVNADVVTAAVNFIMA
jgi:predicted esterase